MGDLFKEILSAEESLFLNPQFLDYDYMPKIIRFRENEQQHIALAIKPLLEKRNGKNLVIKGGPGIGKTIGVRSVINELQDEFGNEIYCVYINCWKKDSPFKIVMSMCEQLGYKWTHNKNFDELMKEAANILNEKCAVIVLDEVDKLTDNNIIYTLLEDIYKKTLILITNSDEFLANLDSRIRSRLTPDILEFKPYNRIETEGILKERLEFAFVPNTFDKNAFSKVVEKTFELGDIRAGLFLMKEAGEIAEEKSKKKIEVDDADKAILKLEEFKAKKIDTFVNEDVELIELIKNNSGKTTKELFEIYRKKEDKSYRTFQRKLKILEKSGMVLLKEINKGFEGGRTTVVEYDVNKRLDEFLPSSN